MFHEMSAESKESLIQLFTKCQDQIRAAEGVKRKPPTFVGDMETDSELRPGIGHAYMYMTFAIKHLRAPNATESDLIEETRSDRYLTHSSGCYTVHKVMNSWRVGRYTPPGVKEPLWIVTAADSPKRRFFVKRHGESYPYTAGNNWLSVFETIVEYCNE